MCVCVCVCVCVYKYDLALNNHQELISHKTQPTIKTIIACEKNWPFQFLYEKYQISSCTTYLIKKNCHSHVPGYGPD